MVNGELVSARRDEMNGECVRELVSDDGGSWE